MSLFKRKDNKAALRDDLSAEVEDTNVKVDDEPTGFRKFINLFKFDSHRQIERRIFYFAAALGLLIIGVGVSKFHATAVAKEQALKTTAYKTEIGFSKTDATMKLGKVAISTDRHRAFIPFELSTSSDSGGGNLSINAKNYRVLYAAASGDLTYKPKGQFVLFGDTNRGMIMLQSATPIQNQPVTVVVRNEKNLRGGATVTPSADISDDQGMAKLQKRYDMAYFKVNPGARNAVDKPDFSLDKGTPTAEKLYQSFYGDKDLKVVNKDVKKRKQRIKDQMALMEEYKHRLKLDGYKVPADPGWIKDGWKPYDYVDPKTGEIGRGKDKLKAGTDIDTGSGDPDDVQYADDLQRIDGKGSMNSDAEQNDSGNNDDIIDEDADSTEDEQATIGGSQQEPEQIWQSLQDTWNNIRANKRGLMVNDNKSFYLIKSQVAEQKQQASMGPAKKFEVRGSVKVEDNN